MRYLAPLDMTQIQPLLQKEISLNGHKINYHLKFSKRRTIEVRILANKKIQVSAPHKIKIEGVEKFLYKRSIWIIENLNKYKSYNNISKPTNFSEGENIHYLGNEYIIRIKRDLVSDIEISETELIVRTPYINNNSKIKKLIIDWYKTTIAEVFDERLLECLKITNSVINVNYSGKIQPRKMDRRWGTCTADNKIILNSNLIFLDIKYIDYVILHELCHFREKNHGKRYYALLSAVCPDYKIIRKGLNKNIIESFL